MKMHAKKIQQKPLVGSGGLVMVVLTLGIFFLNPAMKAQEPAAGVEGKDQGTVVTSTRFRLDLSKKEGVFTGEVKVKDPSFELNSDELVVYFDDKNQVERLLARGKVTLVQGGKRSATCREAEYVVAEKSLKLTGDPVVSQEGNEVTGTVIKIYPEGDRMEVDGRSKVEFFLD